MYVMEQMAQVVVEEGQPRMEKDFCLLVHVLTQLLLEDDDDGP